MYSLFLTKHKIFLFVDMLCHTYMVIAHINPALCFPLPILSVFANPLYVTHFFTYLENQRS
jgi:hypothetical protein